MNRRRRCSGTGQGVFRAIVVLLAAAVVWTASGLASGARTLDEIKDRRIVRIALKESFPPFGFIDASRRWIGFDVEIGLLLARQMREDFAIKTMFIPVRSSSDRPKLLVNDNTDIVIASYSITPSRRKTVDFSRSYFHNQGLMVMVPAGKTGEIGSYHDLTDRLVVVTGRSTGEKFLIRNVDGVNLVPVANDDYAVKLLQEGRAEAYVQDLPVCLFHLGKDGDWDVVGKPFTLGGSEDHYGIAVKKGSADLVHYINLFISRIKGNGTYRRIYRRWFGSGLGKEATPSLPAPVSP